MNCNVGSPGQLFWKVRSLTCQPPPPPPPSPAPQFNPVCQGTRAMSSIRTGSGVCPPRARTSALYSLSHRDMRRRDVRSPHRSNPARSSPFRAATEPSRLLTLIHLRIVISSLAASAAVFSFTTATRPASAKALSAAPRSRLAPAAAVPVVLQLPPRCSPPTLPPYPPSHGSLSTLAVFCLVRRIAACASGTATRWPPCRQSRAPVLSPASPCPQCPARKDLLRPRAAIAKFTCSTPERTPSQ
jgi:hypothetical protein